MEIVKKYGSFEKLCNTFSYVAMNDITENPIEVFRRDTPSLVRMDVTYGKGSSSAWLYDILQATFLFLGVTNDKFAKEQVYDLARVIASQYKSLKTAELLLFISRFKAGRYGRFYGDTSYALVMTEALKTFMEERSDYYQQVEREKIDKKLEEEKKQPKISFEEWQKEKEAKGEEVHLSAVKGVDRSGREVRTLKPLETLVDMAQSLIENRNGLSMKSLLEMRKLFREKNGLTPEEVVEKFNKNEL